MEELFEKLYEWELHVYECSVCRMFAHAAGAPHRSFFVVCVEGRALLTQIMYLLSEFSRGNA